MASAERSTPRVTEELVATAQQPAREKKTRDDTAARKGPPRQEKRERERERERET